MLNKAAEKRRQQNIDKPVTWWSDDGSLHFWFSDEPIPLRELLKKRSVYFAPREKPTIGAWACKRKIINGGNHDNRNSHSRPRTLKDIR